MLAPSAKKEAYSSLTSVESSVLTSVERASRSARRSDSVCRRGCAERNSAGEKVGDRKAERGRGCGNGKAEELKVEDESESEGESGWREGVVVVGVGEGSCASCVLVGG
jgi:hypothetical protein